MSRFWTDIAKVTCGILRKQIKKDPGVFLLGLPSKDLHLPRNLGLRGKCCTMYCVVDFQTKNINKILDIKKKKPC